MNVIVVVCGVVWREGKILCAQRSNLMKHPKKWEFPGGKVEGNESQKAALQREFKEELGIAISDISYFTTTIHQTDNATIHLVAYQCHWINGEQIQVKEHQAISWLFLEELHQLDWLSADLAIVKKLQALQL